MMRAPWSLGPLPGDESQPQHRTPGPSRGRQPGWADTGLSCGRHAPGVCTVERPVQGASHERRTGLWPRPGCVCLGVTR